MTIAIHISAKDDIQGFFEQAFIYAAEEFSSDHFIFIFDTPLPANLVLPPNCTPVQTGPEIKNSLIRHYWYNYKIPSILNRYQADVLFTPREVCSLNTAVPQVMLLSSVTQRTGGYREQFRKKYAERVSSIGAFEKWIYARAVKVYAKQKEKIKYIGHGINTVAPLPESESASDAPYFAVVLNKNNSADSIALLKAFSIFKKWQRSSYKLVLVVSPSLENPVPHFSSYKYRDDVVLLRENDQVRQSNILGGAFANIQLFHPSSAMQVELAAMHEGIPLVSTCPEKDREHFFAHAALYATNTEAGISEQMMRLYKDEDLYREYSAKAREFAKDFTWQKTAQTLYDMAMRAVAQTP